jgi:hypothetical protein
MEDRQQAAGLGQCTGWAAAAAGLGAATFGGPVEGGSAYLGPRHGGPAAGGWPRPAHGMGGGRWRAGGGGPRQTWGRRPSADQRKTDQGAAHLGAAAGGVLWVGGRRRTGGARVPKLEAEMKFWVCLRELEEETMFCACAEVTAVGTRGRVNNRSV